MTSPPPQVRLISTCTVKPQPQRSEDAAEAPRRRRCELALWDVAMLSVHYIQKGHLFSIPSHSPDVDQVVDRLKTALSVALRHFYPLAGRLKTDRATDESAGIFVYLDCNDEGAEFIHAAADGVGVADVVAPLDPDVPCFVRYFFPLDEAINHDGHSLPLLAVQVTELVDGVFVGCSFNHTVGDGTSFWHFFNAWSEISRAIGGGGGGDRISRPPVHDRWFVDDGGRPPIRLPFSREEEFIERFSPPILRERIFHFAPHSIAAIKARANGEGKTNQISSFQALSALVWRSITRARRFPCYQKTSCRLAAQNRARMRPPLSPDYFGNSIYALIATTTAGELLAHDLGWSAWLVNRSVASHTDDAIRGMVGKWMESRTVYRLSGFDRWSVMMGSSPRFDMYGCDFGWGKAVALRSGGANKFDGKVSSYPGREGGGSVDLEVCLPPETMAALETDEEFMSAVSPPPLKLEV